MTQLEKLNLNGKTIYPFNTHGGSGVGNTVTDIKQYATGANVKDGFPLLGTYVKNNKENAMNDITNWIGKNFEIITNTNSETTDNTSTDIKDITSTVNSSTDNTKTDSTSTVNSSTEIISTVNASTNNVSTDKTSTDNVITDKASDSTKNNSESPNKDDEEEEENFTIFSFSEVLKCKYFLVLILLSSI